MSLRHCLRAVLWLLTALGAYALAAGTAMLHRQTDLSRLFDAQREAQLWEAVLEKETLVDGVTGRKELAVDGQPWSEYRRPFQEMRTLLEDCGFTPFVKTTGGKGIHVVVAIKAAARRELPVAGRVGRAARARSPHPDAPRAGSRASHPLAHFARDEVSCPSR